MRRPKTPAWLRGALCAVVAFACGCVFLDVREQQKEIALLARVGGRVATEHSSAHPLVVVLIRREGESWSIFDHFVVEGAGRWAFVVTPGTYALGAFEDANENLVYDPEESALAAVDGPQLVLAAGAREEGIDLRIPIEGRARIAGSIDITALQARTHHDQLHFSAGLLSVQGERVSLDDARFDPEKGRLGLWKPLDFVLDVGAGIYFLEDHVEGKIPVLFVHGIEGTPRQFAPLVESLDADRYEPWLYYYASGGRLESVSDHLAQLVLQLTVRHRVERLCVVAHSMGGLVARSFILKHHARGGRAAVPVFVSISTPWDGHAAAQQGVEHAPAVVGSWRDVAPGSEFLHRLFFEDPGRGGRRHLPGPISHQLLFGYRRGGFGPGPSEDGVVTVASELRIEAQEDASGVRGFDEDHTSILRSRLVSAYLTDTLARTFE